MSETVTDEDIRDWAKDTSSGTWKQWLSKRKDARPLVEWFVRVDRDWRASNGRP